MDQNYRGNNPISPNSPAGQTPSTPPPADSNYQTAVSADPSSPVYPDQSPQSYPGYPPEQINSDPNTQNSYPQGSYPLEQNYQNDQGYGAPSEPPPPPVYHHGSNIIPVIIGLLVFLIIAGFIGSFVFFRQKKPSQDNTIVQQPVTTPTVAILPSPTPKGNPFPTPTIVYSNPFAYPTVAYGNPFGSYQNPFAGATGSAQVNNQPYQNPFNNELK